LEERFAGEVLQSIDEDDAMALELVERNSVGDTPTPLERA
jgi:hypothetical protein